MSAGTVFAIAKTLVQLPTGSGDFAGSSGSGGSGRGAGDVGIGTGTGTGTDTGTTTDGGSNSLGFSMSPPPGAPAIENSPTAAAYTGVTSALTWANPPAAIVPSYATPENPPTMPSATVSGVPAVPQVGLLEVKRSAGLAGVAAPDITIGARPALINPTLAAFVATPLAPFAGELPEYEPISVTPLGDPDRLDYTADEALIARIKRTLAGDDVLDVAIRDAIYAWLTRDAARRELFGEQKILGASAAKGFSMPTGAVNAQVAELARELREAKTEAAFAVRDETYARAKALLLDATSKAIAHEAKRFELHLRYGKKLVQTLAFNAKAMREMFDATVGLFNAKAELVNAVVADYKAYVQTVEAQDAARVAQVRAEFEKLATYGVEVDMYEAQGMTAKTLVDVSATSAKQQALKLAEYEAYLIGAVANVDIVRANVEGMREATRAFAKAVDVDAEKFDTQAELVRASGSVAGVWEANVSAYASFWRTEEARSSAYSNYVQDAGRVLDAQAGEFKEYARAHRSWIQAHTAKIQAQASAVSAYSRSLRGAVGYVSAYNRAEAERAGAANMKNMSDASRSMNRQALDASEDAFDARLRANELATSATISGGLAQAALGVISASVSIRGTVDAGRSAGTSSTSDYTESGRRTWTNSRTISSKI